MSAWFSEIWQTSIDSTVYHMSHPLREAWCGARWTNESFLGAVDAARRCKACERLGAPDFGRVTT